MGEAAKKLALPPAVIGKAKGIVWNAFYLVVLAVEDRA